MIIPFLVESSRHSFSSAWLKRAYQRAKEEAEEGGKSLADVVAKRYGVSHIQFKYWLAVGTKANAQITVLISVIIIFLL